MSSSLLRLDWYSFLAGTQISSTIGILTASAYLGRQGINIRFAREYLYPSFSNNGNLLFLYRIKEPGNWVKYGVRLLCQVFEKNIATGVMYVMMEEVLAKYFEENVLKAFVCGGILGLYSCLSYNCYDFQDISYWQLLLCCLSASEIAVLFEEVKFLLSLDRNDFNFNVMVPFNSLIFLNGAIVGSYVRFQTTNFMDTLDDVPIPEIEVTDSNAEIFRKYFQFMTDSMNCALKFILGINERFLVGGIMSCLFHCLIENVTGMNNSFPVILVAGSFHAIFLGIVSGHMNLKNVLKTSCMVTIALQTVPKISSQLRKIMPTITANNTV